jgi:hypothetical protein
MSKQKELVLDEEIFDKLFEFINDDNLSNPYRITTKSGKWLLLSIEDSYDYIQEENYKKWLGK